MSYAGQRDLEGAPPGRAAAWTRLFRVLTSPGQAMAEVAEQPAVLPPYLLWMLVGTVVAVVWAATHQDQIVAQAIQRIQSQPNATAEDLDQLRTIMSFSVYGGALGQGLLGPWLGGLYYGLLMMLFGSFTGQAGRFKQYLSVAGYAAVPVVLGEMLRAPLMMAATDLQAMNQVGFHLGALVPGASGALVGLLMAFDLFGIWSLILIVLGYAAIHRLPPARAAWIGVFFFLVRALGYAGSAALDVHFAGLGG